MGLEKCGGCCYWTAGKSTVGFRIASVLKCAKTGALHPGLCHLCGDVSGGHRPPLQLHVQALHPGGRGGFLLWFLHGDVGHLGRQGRHFRTSPQRRYVPPCLHTCVDVTSNSKRAIMLICFFFSLLTGRTVMGRPRKAYFGDVGNNSERSGLLSSGSQDAISDSASNCQYQGLGRTSAPHSLSAPAGLSSATWEQREEVTPEEEATDQTKQAAETDLIVIT